MKKLLSLFLIVSVFATISATNVQAQKQPDVIPGQYIVVLRDTMIDSGGVAQDMGRAYGFTIAHEYSHALKGFSATIPAARLAVVKADSRVAFVSEDRAVYSDGKSTGESTTQSVQTIPTGITRVHAEGKSNTGAGIGIAIIDTGVDLTHPDLQANIAPQGKSCVKGVRSPNDDNGHGTHVAGTIAALNNSIGVVGIAPNAKLFPVKVLNKSGSGTWSSVICGIDWVAANATTLGIKVANMSLGGGGSSDNNCGITNNDALHKAICNATAKGVTFVVAAGNAGANANSGVPSSYNDTVITVSALADSDGASYGLGPSTGYGADDTFASFSNYGSSVDVGAPGVSIYSTWKGGGYNTISGTSMATPHVAGATALYIATHSGAVWSEVRNALVAIGEGVGFGHTDPSERHPEPVLDVSTL
jgi:subtilisin family serine protease